MDSGKLNLNDPFSERKKASNEIGGVGTFGDLDFGGLELKNIPNYRTLPQQTYLKY